MNRHLIPIASGIAAVAVAGSTAFAQSAGGLPFGIDFGGYLNGTVTASQVDASVFQEKTMDVTMTLEKHLKQACGNLTGPEYAACAARYTELWKALHTQLSRWMDGLDTAFQTGFRMGLDQTGSTPAVIQSWYKLDTDGTLLVRTGSNGSFAAEPAGRWRDAEGNWFRIQEGGVLGMSDDSGLTWTPSMDNRWLGADHAWYRMNNGVLERSENETDWQRSVDQAWPSDGGAPMPVETADTARDEKRQAELLQEAWDECEARSPRTRGECMRDYVNANDGK